MRHGVGHTSKNIRNQWGKAENVENAESTAAGGNASATTTGSVSTAVVRSASTVAAGSASVAASKSEGAPLTMESGIFTPLITDQSTQQSANVVGGPKRKTTKPRRCGENTGSKKPNAAGYDVVFDSSGTVIQRCGLLTE